MLSQIFRARGTCEGNQLRGEFSQLRERGKEVWKLDRSEFTRCLVALFYSPMTFSGFLWTFSRGILDSHQRTLLAEKVREGVWSVSRSVVDVKMGLSAEAPKVSQCCWSQRLFRKKMSIREVKIVFLGSSGVGKTSLVRSFVTKQFTPNVDTTIGASYLTKVMRVDGVGKTEEYEGVTQIVKVSLSQLTGLVNLKVLLGGNFEDSIYYSKI